METHRKMLQKRGPKSLRRRWACEWFAMGLRRCRETVAELTGDASQAHCKVDKNAMPSRNALRPPPSYRPPMSAPSLDNNTPVFRLTSNVWAGYSPRLLRARYAPATRPLRARYAPATRRRFCFAREPYYRSLMTRLLKHKWPKTWHN